MVLTKLHAKPIVTPRDRPGEAARRHPTDRGLTPVLDRVQALLPPIFNLREIKYYICPGIHIDVPCGPTLRNITA